MFMALHYGKYVTAQLNIIVLQQIQVFRPICFFSLKWKSIFRGLL